MPNWSHGLAGVAAALAVAGRELGREELVAAARSGAEHLVTLGATDDDGFLVPAAIPASPGLEEITYSWCHGPTGTSLLFTALEHARVVAEQLLDRDPELQAPEHVLLDDALKATFGAEALEPIPA